MGRLKAPQRGTISPSIQNLSCFKGAGTSQAGRPQNEASNQPPNRFRPVSSKNFRPHYAPGFSRAPAKLIFKGKLRFPGWGVAVDLGKRQWLIAFYPCSKTTSQFPPVTCPRGGPGLSPTSKHSLLLAVKTPQRSSSFFSGLCVVPFSSLKGPRSHFGRIKSPIFVSVRFLLRPPKS